MATEIEQLKQKYNYIVKENFALHHELSALKAEKEAIHYTSELEKTKCDIQSIQDNLSRMSCTLTKSDYTINDTKNILTTCMSKVDNLEILSKSLENNNDSIKSMISVNKISIEELGITVKNTRTFIKNEIKGVLLQQKEIMAELNKEITLPITPTIMEVHDNQSIKKPSKVKNPYKAQTPSKPPPASNPSIFFYLAKLQQHIRFSQN